MFSCYVPLLSLTIFCLLLCPQRSKVKSTTPITTELFAQWKRAKIEQREAELAAKRAERAKNDRMRLWILVSSYVVLNPCLLAQIFVREHTFSTRVTAAFNMC